MEVMRLYEVFEEDTSNLLSIARWAMEKHPDEVKEVLGITHDYYVRLLLLVCQLSKQYRNEGESNETH